jgi:hypothetical protein
LKKGSLTVAVVAACLACSGDGECKHLYDVEQLIEVSCCGRLPYGA